MSEPNFRIASDLPCPIPNRHWRRAYYHLLVRSSYEWFRVACRGRVGGVAHVEDAIRSGCVLVANHVSYLDWLVLHGLFLYRFNRRLCFLAKDKLFRHRVWGPLMPEGGSVRVSDDGDSILDRQGFRRLLNEDLIGVFPEGTRSSDGQIGPCHAGAVKLAARLGKPILPVTLEGFYESWPRGRAFPIPRRCTIHFQPSRPVASSCLDDPALAQAVLTDVMKGIDGLLDRERGRHDRFHLGLAGARQA
jgi:1-acyl-sn-glycerol-3-phosphate acyltransferase